MSETTTEVAEKEEEFTYPIRVEDAGPATKKVFVEIPRERIDAKMAEQFKELRQQAAVPGFRVGHVPQKLIEKRFSGDVKEQVRRSLISESFEQAVQKNSLAVIGEPEFDNPDAIKLPEEGALSYSFQVEVQPEITLPDVTQLKIKKPSIKVTEENVDLAMQNLREQQGALVPVEDRGVASKDYLTADVHIKVDGEEVGHQENAAMVARPGRIGGIQIDDLDTKLEGMKAGEKRSFNVQGPAEHPNEKIKGKTVEVEVDLKDIKRLELADISNEFLEGLGFQNEKELRDALREQLEERIQFDVQQAMREQVNTFLLEKIQIELPTKLSDRQVDRAVSRRSMELSSRGVPADQIMAITDRIRTGAKDEAIRELKLFFILQKVANDRGVDVDEAELNGRIAMLAVQRGRRPEKLKQDMATDGTLSNLYVQMREQKAIDQIIAQAQVEDVDLTKAQEQAPKAE